MGANVTRAREFFLGRYRPPTRLGKYRSPGRDHVAPTQCGPNTLLERQCSIMELFLNRAAAPAIPSIADIAPYAGAGAFYFLVSAIWMTVSAARRRKATAPV